MNKTAWSKDLDLIIGGTSDEGLVIYKSLKSQPDILTQPQLLQGILPINLVDETNNEKAKEIAYKLERYYIGNEILSLARCDGFLKVSRSITKIFISVINFIFSSL